MPQKRRAKQRNRRRELGRRPATALNGSNCDPSLICVRGAGGWYPESRGDFRDAAAAIRAGNRLSRKVRAKIIHAASETCQEFSRDSDSISARLALAAVKVTCAAIEANTKHQIRRIINRHSLRTKSEVETT